MARYLPVTIMGGRLFVESIPDWGDWDNRRLRYESEELVAQLLQGLLIDRKADTVEELARLVDDTPGLPAVRVWVLEGLEEAARAFWVGSHSGRHSP